MQVRAPATVWEMGAARLSGHPGPAPLPDATREAVQGNGGDS